MQINLVHLSDQDSHLDTAQVHERHDNCYLHVNREGEAHGQHADNKWSQSVWMVAYQCSGAVKAQKCLLLSQFIDVLSKKMGPGH